MSAQQFTDSAKIKLLEWRMAICWFVLFTIGSLASAISASLVNADYSAMNGQSRFLMYLAIIISWANTMMAFFSKAAKKVDSQINGDGTQFITRAHTETDSLKISAAPDKSDLPQPITAGQATGAAGNPNKNTP